MKNTELLQAICASLSLTADDLREQFELCGRSIASDEVNNLLTECSDQNLRTFLEGLILAQRGPRSDGEAPVIEDTTPTNNEVLKKLRIALNMHEADMMLVFEESGTTLSRSEFSALFRKPDNKHYRPCSDELLLQFLRGLQPQLDT